MKHLSYILLVTCGLSLNTATAQFVHQQDYKPLMTKDYTNIEGSPYLYDDWIAGTVKLANGVTNKEPIMLKYNLLDDEVYFKDKAGEAMAFVVPVQEFTLNPTQIDATLARRYRNGYKGIDGIKPAAYFEVLSDGKVQLIKKIVKVIFETQNIGSAAKTRSFIDKTKYYLVIDGNATAVKNDKKSLLATLSDKETQLEAYIKTNKVDFKKDADLAKLVTYYNSL